MQHPRPPNIAARLSRLRRRARALLVLHGTGVVLALVILAVILAGLADYLLRLPPWLRGGVWGMGAAGLVVLILRLILPALRFAPSLTEVALRVEGSGRGRRAGLTGVLASGLELRDEHQTPLSEGLARRVTADAERRFADFPVGAILRGRTVAHALAGVATAITLAALLFTAEPVLARIGAVRTLAPWSGAQWPKVTGVADATGIEVHPLGAALALRAAVVRTNRPEGQTRVTLRHRVITEAGAGPLVRTPMNPQSRRVEIAAQNRQRVSGELFERLVEPAGVDRGRAEAIAELEYWFETEDDRTPPRRIRLVEPPAVVGAVADIAPPGYARHRAAREADAGAGFVAGRHELGPGSDQRAVVGPVLAGSVVRLEVSLNKAVPGPAAGDEQRWIDSSLPGADLGEDPELLFDGGRWSLTWVAAQSTRIPIVATDRFGLQSVEDSVFAFDVVQDRPPTAVVIDPAEDEQVLATAAVEFAGEGRDDVGILRLWLQTQHARPPGGSIGAAPDAIAEHRTVATRDLAEERGGSLPPQATAATSLDLSAFGLVPGDELWLTALATDALAAGPPSRDPAPRDPVRSGVRRLRIIGEEQLVDQVRSELSNLREAAIRLDQEQADLAAATRQTVSPDQRRRQAGIGERLSRHGETVQRLRERVQRNRLDDEAISGALGDVRSLLEEAARQSRRAEAEMDAARRESRLEEEEPAELSGERAAELARAQEQVRDELGRLIGLLDRGEDGWLVRRSLQRLAQQQRELREATRAAGENTVGRSQEELTAEERAELARLAEQQRRLSEQARKTLDELAERARQMQDADAAQAAAMERAAERGRQSRVPETMEQASRSVGQNQTSAAEQQQTEALDAMQDMMDELDSAERNRDQALRRILADLMQSLDGLIRQQRGELEALEKGRGEGELAGLHPGMIRMNQNTLGVLDHARQGFREMEQVAELIQRAAEAQPPAVRALRADPVDDRTAEAAELDSLEKLRLARAEASRQDEAARRREIDRQRGELQKVYRETLEEQVALRAETTPFLDQELDRRDRMTVRGLGERQQTLRDRLGDLRTRTSEIAEAGVFELAHRRLDDATGRAAGRLRTGTADRPVALGQDSAVRILRALVEALSERAPRDDEFRDAENAEGGGGGGQSPQQPLIPDLAQLRLLRGLQQEAADLTRVLDQESPAQEPAELDALARLQDDLAQQGEALIEKLAAQQQPQQQPPAQEQP